MLTVLETAESFGKSVSKERFLKQQGFALKMHSSFSNKYLCESTFSTMKQVQSKNRNQMAQETLVDSLRLAPLTLVLIKKHLWCQRSLNYSHSTYNYSQGRP